MLMQIVQTASKLILNVLEIPRMCGFLSVPLHNLSSSQGEIDRLSFINKVLVYMSPIKP